MNYKQMLLLEELVNCMGANGIYKLHFIMDNVLCSEDFRKNQNDNLDTEKLVDDFIQFMNAHEEYFEDLRNHLEENEAYKDEKMENSVFNSMVVFLMQNENRVDGYLKDPEVSEVIYNFYKGNEYLELYSALGTLMNPFDMYLIKRAED